MAEFDRRVVSHVEEPDHPVYQDDVALDVHERIAAAVADRRRFWQEFVPGGIAAFVLAACDYTDDVLARHRQDPDTDIHGGLLCMTCGFRTGFPCPEIRALAAFWLGEGWEQA